MMELAEITQLTRELMGFSSMHSRPEEIRKCADFVAGFLAGQSIRFERLEHGGIPSILVLPGKAFAPVVLMSHLDVVAAPDELFLPEERDGKLYGRGSLDDKYAVALSLVLLKHWMERLRRRGLEQTSLPFGLVITGDEEIGGENGARQAIERVDMRFCIALDGGCLEKIVVKEKGILRLKLIARGRTAHGARPWLGENAIDNLIADYLRVREIFRPPAAPADPHHWQVTMNLGIIRGGTSANQVPDEAEAILDIRYTEHDDVDTIIAEARRRVRGEVRVEAREPLFIGGDSPYLSRLLAVAKDARLGFEHGASDARFLSSRGIPGVVWGAGGDLSAHSLEEHVNLADVGRLYALLDAFLSEVGSR